MNKLQKELQDLKAKVAELEARITAEPVKKWEPKGGDFYVGTGGSVSMIDSRVFTKEFGLERKTREQAERAAIEMRRFNRLLALRDELCGDDEVNWSSDSLKYYVFYSFRQKVWLWTESQYLITTTVYFTTTYAAQKACDMLNSGEVEL